GDNVAILMGNRPEWIATWIALNKIGAVAVGISTWSTIDELRYVLRHSDAKMIVLCRELRNQQFVSMMRELCPELDTVDPGRLFVPQFPFLRTIVLIDDAV